MNDPSSHKLSREGRGIFISSPVGQFADPPIVADVPFTKGIFASSFVHSFSSTPAYETKGRRAASLSLERVLKRFCKLAEFLYTRLEKVYPLLPPPYSLNLFLLGDLLCTSPCAVTKTFPRLCVPQVISVSFGFQTRSRQRG